MNFSSYIEENIREKLEELKDTFSTSMVENINIYFLYVINQQCEEYKKIVVSLKNGVLSKDTLLAEIIKNRNDGGRRFNVTGIYTYGFDTDLATFMEQGDKGLTELKEVESITFLPSVDYFQHHNSVFIFFSNEKNKHTKKTTTGPKKRTLKTVSAYE